MAEPKLTSLKDVDYDGKLDILDISQPEISKVYLVIKTFTISRGNPYVSLQQGCEFLILLIRDSKITIKISDLDRIRRFGSQFIFNVYM